MTERYERLRTSVLQGAWACCSEVGALLHFGMSAWLQRPTQLLARVDLPASSGGPALQLGRDQAGLAGLIADMAIASAQQGANA